MAKGYTNSVPLGREGTGAATVLGPSRALQYWLGVSQQDQNRLQAQQDRYQQTQESYNQQFAKDINSAANSLSSPLWSQDFTKRGSGLISSGAKLTSQGINPYRSNLNHENQEALAGYRSEANTLLNLKSQADDLRKWQTDTLKKMSQNPGQYRQEDISKVRDLDKNFSFEDLEQGGVQIPEIQPKIDFQKQGSDAKFSATVTKPIETRLADGTVRTDTSTRLDTKVAENYINNAFRPNTAYAKEVEARLREKGIDEPFSKLLQTTNKDEIKTYLDSMFRSTDDDNPVTTLMAEGKIPNIDTPEYERFLNDSVNEQLKAEKILEQSKNEFLTGLQAGVKESDKISYSAVQANNRRAEQRFKTQQQKDMLSMQKTKLQISGLKKDDQPDDVYDLKIRSEVSPNEYILSGAKSGSTTNFNFNISDNAYNTTVDQPVEGASQARGSLIGTGVIAIDKKSGNPLSGYVNQYIGNPDVEFGIKGQILTDDGDSILENPDVIAQTLAGESKKFASKSLENAKLYQADIKKKHQEALNKKSSPIKKTKSDPLGLGL